MWLFSRPLSRREHLETIMDPTTIFHMILTVVPARYLVDVAALCGVSAAVMPWLPVPARAQSAYGRLYATLNVTAQNFRNVANAMQPGNKGSGSSGPGTPVAVALLFGLGVMASACTTTGGTTAIDTAELAADAGAVDFAAQAIEAIPGLSAHLTAAQTAQVNDALAQIKTITAQINAASGGAIDIRTGQGWASALASEFQTILGIATPIVSAFAPEVGVYIQTAEQIIPLIEAAVGVTPAGVSVSVGARPAAQVRAALYRGV
jgi:hypothetical protein